MSNVWESEGWRETLTHEGLHYSALTGYRSVRPTERPADEYPVAARQNGRESATDIFVIDARR